MPVQLPPPYQHPANGNLLTPFQLPLEKEAELQNWHVVDKFNKMLISFKIVKSEKLLTFKAEVNRFQKGPFLPILAPGGHFPPICLPTK